MAIAITPQLKKYVRKLISEEYFCSQTYLLFIEAIKPDKKYIVEGLFEEISEDEYHDHYKKLVNWVKANGLMEILPVSYNDFVKYAGKKSVDNVMRVKSAQDVDFYLETAIDLEKNAMKTYTEALELVKDYKNEAEHDLYQILLNNYYDESEHLNLLTTNLIISKTTSAY